MLLENKQKYKNIQQTVNKQIKSRGSITGKNKQHSNFSEVSLNTKAFSQTSCHINNSMNIDIYNILILEPQRRI